MHSSRISSKRSEDAMDDDSDDRDSKRKSRNLSEKKRRDQFNVLVNELNTMVSSGNRKMDKSTVLKSTISFLKTHNEFTVRSRVNEIQECWKPTFLTNEEFTHLVLEAVDGFIVAFSTYGPILYVSESVTSLLGHSPSKILNSTIYELAFHEDHRNLYNALLNTSRNKKRQVSFSCHLQRGTALDSNQSNCYELVHFVGYLRSDEDVVESDSSKYSCNGSETDNRLIFVGTGRLEIRHLLREVPLIESSKCEFTSRHSLEWKFLFLDHRAPPIIGYLPFELLGTSGYDYYHVDDLEKVANCHASLMQKGEGTSCYYRFLTKGQQWIWLQTRFYISYHQWNSKPEFIVCTHRVVSYLDVTKSAAKKEDITDVAVDSSSFSVGDDLPDKKQSRTTAFHSGQDSDATSLSADSLTSKESTATHRLFTKSKHDHRLRHTDTRIKNTHQQPQSKFIDVPHFVGDVPMQPALTAIPATAIVSPVTNAEKVAIPQAQTHLQADLQRKHAELQTIIDQQQAELRRVSEQLLMARLGLLSTQNEPMPLAHSCNVGNVSSTTGVSMPVAVPPTLAAPVSASLSVPVVQNQTNLTFSSADSNTSPKPN